MKYSEGQNPDRQLQAVVRRLLRSNERKSDAPIIVAGLPGSCRVISVGRLLERNGARLTALVDAPVEAASAVTVFIPGNAYVAEVVTCERKRKTFRVDVQLIMNAEAASAG